MAEQIVLEVEARDGLGTGASRRLRREADMVPGILYGGADAPAPIALSYRTLTRAMQQEAFFSQVLDVALNGEHCQAVLRELQRHPATDRVLHVDLLRIQADRPIQIAVPLHFVNEDKCLGVRTGGGTITRNMIELEVSCLPGDLPEHIEIDLEPLDVGHSVHLSELAVPDGVTIVALAHGADRDAAVVSVQIPRGGLLDEEEELAAEGEEGVGDEAAAGEGDADASGSDEGEASEES